MNLRARILLYAVAPVTLVMIVVIGAALYGLREEMLKEPRKSGSHRNEKG